MKNFKDKCYKIFQAMFPDTPPGKPKNTGVGSLSLLQHIFPTQESNQGLLRCRQILYRLSYQGSPKCKNERQMILTDGEL